MRIDLNQALKRTYYSYFPGEKPLLYSQRHLSWPLLFSFYATCNYRNVCLLTGLYLHEAKKKLIFSRSISLANDLDCTACDIILFKPYRNQVSSVQTEGKFRANGPIPNFVVSNLDIYLAPIT